MATLWLMVGLPAAGKTTEARRLAGEHAALRFTPDHWMIPLFNDNDANGKRDVLEGRLIWTALEALALGTNVVLDFGLWSRAERASLAWLAAAVGASCHTVYLPVEPETQLSRARQRWRDEPGTTFEMTASDLDGWRGQFEVPDADELADRWPTEPPDPWLDWGAWAVDRWPSLTLERVMTEAADGTD